MEKKLTKSNNKMLSGVLAGIAEYCDCDPTVIPNKEQGIGNGE